MKKFNLPFILILFTLFIFTSCQDEVTEITEPDAEETIVPQSTLANSMLMTATRDGSWDNIIDGASCLSVELPVTVVVNGIEITIDSEEDYDVIEAIFDEFNDDNDVLEIQFPIIIILSDYSEIVIESYDELELFIEECSGENEDDDDIECIDFVYPISISIYNSNFQVIDTVVIQSDEQLYYFIEELEGGVLASINFPITMVLSNGDEIVVNTNAELEAAITNADGTCDEDDDNDYNDDDCTEEVIELALMECLWEISDFNGDDVFNDYYIDFDPNFGYTVVSASGNIEHEGTWSVSEVDGDFIITFDTDWQDLAGEWTVENCSDTDEFNLINGDITMQIEQDCNVASNPLGCLEASNIVMCDENNDGFEVFNLYEGLSEIAGCTVNSTVSVSYHTSLEDAENNTNPISSVTSFTNISNPQTIYVRIEVLNNPSEFEVLDFNLILEDCNSSCSELDVDQYLTTCIWNVVNYDGSNDLISFDFDFNSDGTVIITGEGQSIVAMWSTSQSSNGGVEVEFSNINLGIIQAISGNWLVIDCQEDRLEFDNYQNVTMVMEQQNCYTEEELLNTISNCSWEVSSFTVDNQDVTSNYNDVLFTFFENDFAIAEVGTSTVNYGNLEAEGTGSEELVVLFFMYGFTSELSDYYTVSSITDTQITLTSLGSKVLVLSQNCDHNNQDADTEQIKDWLDEGTWEITYATMDSVDESTDYDGVTFDFQSDADLIGYNSNNDLTSELQYEVLRDGDYNLRMVINYLGIFPYWQMDDDWYITEVDSTRIELHYVNDDLNIEFVLVFERI